MDNINVLTTGDTHVDRLRAVPTDDDLAALRARNLNRAKAAIRAMGPRYCCHPANRVPRKAPEPDAAEIRQAQTLIQRWNAATA